MISKDNLLYIFKYLILTISIFVLNFILVFKASALEIRYPSTSVVKGNTTYYGYNIPTRATGSDSLASNVHLNITIRSNVWGNKFSDSLKLGLRDLDSSVVDLLKSTTPTGEDYKSYYQVPSVWSTTYQQYGRYNYMGYGFRPGASVSSDNEVLEDGFAINYDSIYSYDYDVVISSDSYLSNSVLDDNPYFCFINSITNDYQCTKYNTNYISVEKLVDTDTIKYYRYHVKFNSYTFGYGFNKYVLENQNNMFGMDGNNLFGNDLEFPTNHINITFSEPYNIVLWSTSSSLSCINSCWTQEDTNNNQRILNDSNYLWNQLQDYVDEFKYYGFGGIVTLTYNYIIDLLQDNTCPVLNVPVLSKSFNLPSACSFWNRSDVSTFDSLWSMVWLGLVSYYVCWRIFKDILRLYDPSTSVIEGNEVADL